MHEDFSEAFNVKKCLRSVDTSLRVDANGWHTDCDDRIEHEQVRSKLKTRKENAPRRMPL